MGIKWCIFSADIGYGEKVSLCNSMPFGACRAYCAIVSISIKSSVA